MFGPVAGRMRRVRTRAAYCRAVIAVPTLPAVFWFAQSREAAKRRRSVVRAETRRRGGVSSGADGALPHQPFRLAAHPWEKAASPQERHLRVSAPPREPTFFAPSRLRVKTYSINASTTLRLPRRKASATWRRGAMSTSLSPARTIRRSDGRGRHIRREARPPLSGTAVGQDQAGAAVVERQRAPVRLDDDVPALRALLAEVEVGGDAEAGIVGEGDARGDRGIAVFGVIQLRLGDEERARQDAGDDREGVDAGIEHAEAAASRIHAWPGCQTRMSSRHVTVTRSIRASANAARAGSTPGA